jgi:hypothetical protein
MDKSNSISKVEGNKVIYPAGCNTDKFILSKDILPRFLTYVEIQREHIEGCYDSIGVCTKREVG